MRILMIRRLISLSRWAMPVLALGLGLAGCATRPPAERMTAQGGASFSLSLPQDSAKHQSRSSQPRRQVVIEVGQTGSLKVNGARCRAEQLAAKLERLAQRGPFRVIVRVAGDSAMARCLLVVDACRSAGIEHISLIAR